MTYGPSSKREVLEEMNRGSRGKEEQRTTWTLDEVQGTEGSTEGTEVVMSP